MIEKNRGKRGNGVLHKKIISIFLTAALLLGSCPEIIAAETEAITAPAAVLMESQTGKILFEKNAHQQRPCASVTKVMTLLLVFEAIDSGSFSLDTMITASEHAASMGGSDIWLEPGETMSADDLIRATVVASANDAAVALAEEISGSEDAFVDRMNERAKQLGMKDTVFKNCNGLDEDGHVTSAYDVAVMSRELTKHEKIFDYTSIWIDYLRNGKTQLVNTNKLLKTYKGITGLKTGTTDDAGCCISATAARDGMSLIGVILGCDNGKKRFAEAAYLLDYGFANYSVKELSVPGDMPLGIEVENGMESSVELSCKVNTGFVISKATSDEITSKVDLPESIEAPVEEGQVIGRLSFESGDQKRDFEITAGGAVERMTFGGVFKTALNSLLTL
jgi:D-alanyl-D-alanine carboxypeptidase (penicillin-binding protein 5/6)